MRRWFAVFAAILTLTGCSNARNEKLAAWMAPGDQPRALSTTGIVGDMVCQIGGDAIEHIVLIAGELDPHSYTLVKGDVEKIARADVIFSNGLGLEHGASLRAQLDGSDKVCALGDALDQERLLMCDGQIDPHVWMDVSLWSEAIDCVAQRLATLVPDKREAIEGRAASLKEEYAALDAHLCAQFAKISPDRRYLVTSHDAFHYFARRYLIEGDQWRDRFAAPEGLSPDGQLSSHDIKKITGFLKEHNVQVVFPESNVSLDSLRKVVNTAEQLGQQVKLSKKELYGDALGAQGSDQETYIDMMRYNGSAIAGSME